jgi:hypothetical protein
MMALHIILGFDLDLIDISESALQLAGPERSKFGIAE